MAVIPTASWKHWIAAFASVALCGAADCALAQQRALGVDISYWNAGTTSTGISQQNWNTAYNSGNIEFAWIRASRGGTTGLDQPQGTPWPHSGQSTLSHRYDDSRFVQNITRAANAGMLAGAYHYGRPDIAGNTGTDEANHFIQMAGAWMRPGYLMPIFDLEAGSGSNHLAQFSVDFSNRIYQVMRIRPGIYVGGNYSSILQGASASLRHQLAQPSSNQPSVVSPAYSLLWNPRYAYQGNDNHPGIQTANPKDTASTFYGPWDDYRVTHPWQFWQYSSTSSIPGFNAVDSDIDANVSHGDIEYVRNYLVPAVWWNDSSGDWSNLANWNSGQAPVAPTPGPGQATPYASGPLPIARLPGAAGTGPTSGQYDTVILERPNANITVTVSTGTHNVRKLYMRESLDITGGSLTVNYDPTYRPDNSSTVLHAGPISAHFSGPVSLSGSGALNVHSLEIDSTRTFTLGGGSLTFDRINLMPHSASPARIAVTGDVNVNPLNNATATIARGSGSGSSGFVDLSGGTRALNVGNGAAAVDLSVDVPITNGGLIKNGPGTMLLNAANTFAGPVTVNGGTLRYGHSSGLSSSSLVTVNNGALLDLNNFDDSIAALSSDPNNISGAVNLGSANLTLEADVGTHLFIGSITGTGSLTKLGSSTQTLFGSHTIGNVHLNAGALALIGDHTIDAVTVNDGLLNALGSVSGVVTLNDSGRLSIGDGPGTFTAGGLTLEPGSKLDFDLETAVGTNVSDQIVVSGPNGLTIHGGELNLSSTSTPNGTYTLFEYTGTLNGSVDNLSFTFVPQGYEFDLIDTGSAINLVISSGLPGDFNEDGFVDAADYIVWRAAGGSPEELEQWRANFGASSSAAGSGSQTSHANAAVPEPSALALLLLAISACVAVRRAR